MATCPIVRLSTKPNRQKSHESRAKYLARARRHCQRVREKLLTTGEYRNCHESFLIRDIMLNIEETFVDLGTFGVEHIAAGSNAKSPAIDYLNTGDSYDLTLLYVRGRFRVGCWGDIVERGNYE